MANRAVKIESEVFVNVGRFTIDTCLYIPLNPTGHSENFYNLRTQRQNEYACSAARAIKAFRARIFFSKNELTRLFPPRQQTFFSGGWGVGWGLSSEEAMTRRTKTTTGARNHVKGCSTSVTKFTPVTKKRFSLGEIYEECGTRNFPENCNLICFDLALFPRNENKQLKF